MICPFLTNFCKVFSFSTKQEEKICQNAMLATKNYIGSFLIWPLNECTANPFKIDSIINRTVYTVYSMLSNKYYHLVQDSFVFHVLNVKQIQQLQNSIPHWAMHMPNIHRLNICYPEPIMCCWSNTVRKFNEFDSIVPLTNFCTTIDNWQNANLLTTNFAWLMPVLQK
jgi:hypothetical protein